MWPDLLPAGAHLFPGTAGGALTSRLGWTTKVQRTKMDKRTDRFCCESRIKLEMGDFYMDTCRRASTETSW